MWGSVNMTWEDALELLRGNFFSLVFSFHLQLQY